MSRFYTLNLHRWCGHVGCKRPPTHSVTDSHHGQIGTFCEIHAKKLTAELNAEEELRSGTQSDPRPADPPPPPPGRLQG